MLSGKNLGGGVAYNRGRSNNIGTDVLCDWAHYKDTNPDVNRGYGRFGLLLDMHLPGPCRAATTGAASCSAQDDTTPLRCAAAL